MREESRTEKVGQRQVVKGNHGQSVSQYELAGQTNMPLPTQGPVSQRPWKKILKSQSCIPKNSPEKPSTDNIQCLKCGGWFVSHSELSRHQKVCHRICRQCNRQRPFKTEDGFRQHCLAKHIKINRARETSDISGELESLHLGKRGGRSKRTDPGLEDVSEEDLEAGEELESVASSTSSLSQDCLEEEKEDPSSKQIRKEILGVLKPQFKLARVRRKVVCAPEDEGRINPGSVGGGKDNLTVIVKNPELYDYRDAASVSRAAWRTPEGRTTSLQALQRVNLQHRLHHKRFFEYFPQ